MCIEPYSPEALRIAQECGFEVKQDKDSIWLENEECGILTLELFAAIYNRHHDT